MSIDPSPRVGSLWNYYLEKLNFLFNIQNSNIKPQA